MPGASSWVMPNFRTAMTIRGGLLALICAATRLIARAQLPSSSTGRERQASGVDAVAVQSLARRSFEPMHGENDLSLLLDREVVELDGNGPRLARQRERSATDWLPMDLNKH